MNHCNAIILTPVATGTVVPPCDLGYPRVFSEMVPVAAHRETNINTNRARLQHIYRSRLAQDYPLVFLIDSDVVVSKSDLDALIENWKGAGTTACIDTKESHGAHICCACCLLSGEDYLQVKYFDNVTACQCTKLPGPYYVDGLKGKEV